MNLIDHTTAGAKAVRAVVETYGDAELLCSTIIDGMARIDRGLHDHFHHPAAPKDQKVIDTLLDMTNGLHRALVETRERLEKGLHDLDVRRGAS